jgi:hypothetical protein
MTQSQQNRPRFSAAATERDWVNRAYLVYKPRDRSFSAPTPAAINLKKTIHIGRHEGLARGTKSRIFHPIDTGDIFHIEIRILEVILKILPPFSASQPTCQVYRERVNSRRPDAVSKTEPKGQKPAMRDRRVENVWRPVRRNRRTRIQTDAAGFHQPLSAQPEFTFSEAKSIPEWPVQLAMGAPLAD